MPLEFIKPKKTIKLTQEEKMTIRTPEQIKGNIGRLTTLLERSREELRAAEEAETRFEQMIEEQGHHYHAITQGSPLPPSLVYG